jgi:hypothetical protein
MLGRNLGKQKAETIDSLTIFFQIQLTFDKEHAKCKVLRFNAIGHYSPAAADLSRPFQ